MNRWEAEAGVDRESLASRVLLRIENLKKTFINGEREVEVLKGLTFSIYAGERLAIVGASGAGKSTLLHIIGTLERPTSGRIIYGDEDLSGWTESELAAFRNKKIGFIFQMYHLLPEFSALENVMMPALISGMDGAKAAIRARRLLEDVGLGHRLSHKPGQLSGGEQQRVAIARALVLDPEFLLADEPTGNLDSTTGRRIEDLIIQLNKKRGITVVLVTHNYELAKRMTRILFLVDGKISGVRRVKEGDKTGSAP